MSRELLRTRDLVGDNDLIVALYHLPGNEGTPWATWLAKKVAPESTFIGHYFVKKEDAIYDFENR